MIAEKRTFRYWGAAFVAVVTVLAAFTIYAARQGNGVALAGVSLVLVLLAVGLLAGRTRTLFRQLQESEARYRSIIQSMDESVVVIDERGAMQSANPAAERLFGYTESELKGRNVKMLMPQNYADRHDAYLQHYLDTGEKHIIGVGREVHGMRRDGSKFPMQLFVGEMSVGGRRYFTGIMHDISIRKQTEAEVIEARSRAEQAAASKSQFLANMSHEIRTPMNGVLGMLELLSMGQLEPAEKGYVAMAQQSASSLLTLINDILNLSKIEAGAIELDPVPTRLHDTIEDTASVAAGLAVEKRLRLNCFIAADVPQRVLTDPARLRQILLNLLGNAVKFTDAGEVNLTVARKSAAGDRVELEFGVQDTGIGIDPERIENLFDPFTQADSSITRRYGGTGLGLTITRQLVKMLGGEIWAESEPGLGSTFSFTVEVTVLEPGEPVHRPGAEASVRVLVVDDNLTARTNLQRYLADLTTVRAEVADDARSALEILRKAADQGRPFRMVFLKHPLADSMELARAVQADERLKGTRFVTLLPINVPAASVECPGCDTFLTRPVRRSSLAQVLEELSGVEAPSD